MNKKEFKRAMLCGLGRCIEAVQGQDKEKYRDVVLYGCTHLVTLDPQCEGSKGTYLYSLASSYPDKEYFLSAATEKFALLPQCRDWEFAQLTDFIAKFAADGNEEAIEALSAKYKALYSVISTPRKIKFYDYERDNFERLCIAFISLFGESALIPIAKDLGNLFENTNYGSFDFESFFFHAVELFGQAELHKCLDKAASSEEIQRFKEVLEEYERNEALLHERIAAARKARQESDESENVTEVDDEVKKLVRDIQNDKDGFLERMRAVKVDMREDSGWHEVFLNVLNAFDDGFDIPKEALSIIYERSLCSCCRYRAVRLMKELGTLSEETVGECMLDFSPDIRELAKE